MNQGIIASFNGIQLNGGGIVDNSGAIYGTATALSNYGGFTRLTNSGLVMSYSVGVMQAGGLVRNGSPGNTDAAIFGQDVAVQMANSGARIINDGTIASALGSAIILRRGGTVINGHGGKSPALISGNNYGIDASAAANRPSTITNAGAILGDLTGIVLAGGTVLNSHLIEGNVGIRATGSIPTTVVNTGYIDGSGGDAVDFANVDGNVFAMVPHSGFGGEVHGGTLTDTLVLMGPTPVRGHVSDVGALFTDFERIEVADGSSWQLSGINTLPSGGTIAIDGSLEVAGSLVVNHTLNLLNPSGGPLDTFNVAPSGMVEVGSAGTGRAGRLTVDEDGHLNAAGYIAGRANADIRTVNNGTISVVADDSLYIRGKVTGTGTFELGHNSSLFLNDITTIRHFLFPAAGGNEELSMQANTASLPAITGFADADIVDVQGFAADPALTSFAGHILTIEEAGGRTLSLHIAGAGYTLASFQLSDDSVGGTYITHV